jgi:hypothetical protein
VTGRRRLGPAADAERQRQIVRAAIASPKRARATQDDPATLALFAGVLEPSLL